MKRTLFITGTDTGVGKTVLTALLTRFLRERGVNAAALKPVCSGGRADARALPRRWTARCRWMKSTRGISARPIAPLAGRAPRNENACNCRSAGAHSRDAKAIRRAAGGRRGRFVKSARRKFQFARFDFGVARNSNHRRAKQARRGESHFAHTGGVADEAGGKSAHRFDVAAQTGCFDRRERETARRNFSTLEEFSPCRGLAKNFPPARL